MVLNCAKEPEEMRLLFNRLIISYVRLVPLKNCDYDDPEKVAFIRDVTKFVEHMSFDIGVFLHG